MNKNNIQTARDFYKALNERDLGKLETYLHEEVEFIGPFMNSRGKAAYLEGAKSLFHHFKGVTVRAIHGSDHEVLLAYTLHFPSPINDCRTAAFLTFKEGLIARIELFFDAKPFTS